MAGKVRKRKVKPPQAFWEKSDETTILSASVAAMGWRLREAATRIAEANDALERGQHERVMERLFEIEPLVYEAQRILSGAFVLATESADQRTIRGKGSNSA